MWRYFGQNLSLDERNIVERPMADITVDKV
jgi:hypothetical protein